MGYPHKLTPFLPLFLPLVAAVAKSQIFIAEVNLYAIGVPTKSNVADSRIESQPHCHYV